MDLYSFEFLPSTPYVVPTLYPSSPTSGMLETPYHSRAYITAGVATETTYISPSVSKRGAASSAKGSAGNVSTFYGSSPAGGIYTGIQAE
jgi:hypothetical protein